MLKAFLSNTWGKITTAVCSFFVAPELTIPPDQPPPQAVSDEVEPGSYHFNPTMSFWLDVLLEIPDFPQTDQDAENILRFVRSQRDECLLTMEAAEQSVHQCNLQLEILERDPRGTNNATTLRLADLERCKEALVQAEEALEAAELRVDAVQTLLRGKALPLIFPRDAEFRGIPPKSRYDVNDGYASDESNPSIELITETGW